MTLKEQQALFRSCLSLYVRDILKERIGIEDDKKPEEILNEIEKYIRKKMVRLTLWTSTTGSKRLGKVLMHT